MRNTVMKLAVLAFAATGLSACVVAPAPFAGGYYGPRHHGGYYAAPAPRYYAAPAPRYYGHGYGRGPGRW